MLNISALLGETAVSPDTVARHIGSDVDVLPQTGKPHFTGRRDAQQRARLGITLTKQQEIGRMFLGQDHQIALNQIGPVLGHHVQPSAGYELAKAGSR